MILGLGKSHEAQRLHIADHWPGRLRRIAAVHESLPGTKRTNRVGLIVSVEWLPESGRRAVKVALLTKADIGHNGATLDHNGFHEHSCSDDRSELRQLAD